MARQRRVGGLTGYAAMAVAAATWGSLPVIVQRAGAHESVLVCLRMGFGALALAVPVALLPRGARRIERTQARQVVGLGVLQALNWVLFFRALRLLPGATPVLIGYVFPVLVALAAPVVLRERREAHVLPLASLGFAGLCVILAPQVRVGRVAGAVAALASAFTAAALVLVARHVAQRVPAPVVAFGQNATGALVLLPWALATGGRVPWAWGALMGVVHTGATGLLFYIALSRISAQDGGVLMYLEPVSAVLFAWLLLADTPTPAALVGGGLVIGAGAAIVVRGGQAAA